VEGQVRRSQSVDAKRLKVLEDENVKLKKLLADAILDNAMLEEIATKNGDARRQSARLSVTCVRVRGERAAAVIGADRKLVRYRARGADDEPIRTRLREVASERRRFGLPPLHVLLTCGQCCPTAYTNPRIE
jgi:putative transposase